MRKIGWHIKGYYRKENAKKRKKIGVSCSGCGKQRFLPYFYATKLTKRNRCRSCSQSGERHHSYKGSRRVTGGYLRVQADPEKHSVTSDGYILEHRKVMEEQLGRKLLPTETVHHINGVKDDNRIENLELWTGKHGAGVRKLDALIDGINWLFSQKLQEVF